MGERRFCFESIAPSASVRHLGVPQAVLLGLEADHVDDDLGHLPVPLLEVEAGGGARLQHHRRPHPLHVEAAVSDGPRAEGALMCEEVI